MIFFNASIRKYCVDKKNGASRWLKTRGDDGWNDPARIPKNLADDPLNQAERVVISKYVIFGNMNKVNISNGNKLYGHVIAVPLDTDVQERAISRSSRDRPIMEHSIFHVLVIFQTVIEFACVEFSVSILMDMESPW